MEKAFVDPNDCVLLIVVKHNGDVFIQSGRSASEVVRFIRELADKMEREDAAETGNGASPTA